MMNFIKYLMKKIKPKTNFHNIRKVLSNSFNEANNILVSKSDKGITREENWKKKKAKEKETAE